MDGVLSDFVGGMCRAHGIENPYNNPETDWKIDFPKLTGIETSEFWKPCDSKEFWLGLEPLPDGRFLIDYLLNKFDIENLCILTSPTLGDGCAPGKIAWLKKWYPKFQRRFLIGPAKEFCAYNDSVLIDDQKKNCEKFWVAGGGAILWPAPWNENRDFASEYVLSKYKW
jgi:5'(3')-deoxyribonucleotidase